MGKLHKVGGGTGRECDLSKDQPADPQGPRSLQPCRGATQVPGCHPGPFSVVQFPALSASASFHPIRAAALLPQPESPSLICPIPHCHCAPPGTPSPVREPSPASVAPPGSAHSGLTPSRALPLHPLPSLSVMVGRLLEHLAYYHVFLADMPVRGPQPQCG